MDIDNVILNPEEMTGDVPFSDEELRIQLEVDRRVQAQMNSIWGQRQTAAADRQAAAFEAASTILAEMTGKAPWAEVVDRWLQLYSHS